RPDARRVPRAAGVGDDPERPRAPAGMAPGPAEREARHEDAEPAAVAARPRRARLVPGEPEVSVVVTRPRTERLELIWEERPGILGWLTTVDHKRIGLLYFFTTLVFFGAGGIEALLIRTQLAGPNGHVVGPDTFNQLMTMHGVTMIFFFIIPMTTGAFGNYLVPLMIGARDMAFPRLNALSYWLFLGAGLFLYSSMLVHAAPNAGWFDYVPLA